jgi:hypothetical protein
VRQSQRRANPPRAEHRDEECRRWAGQRVRHADGRVPEDGTATLAHETHSITSKDNTFKVTQPHSDMVFDYTPKNPEEMLRLGCEVHRWMVAWVGVESHPYFNVTNETGVFTIANVPPGRHQIRAWHERYGWLTKMVDVKPGETATFDFTYTGQEHPAA